jgi:hypothetical protein
MSKDAYCKGVLRREEMYVLTATRPSLNKTTNDPEVETRSSIQWKVETHTM